MSSILEPLGVTDRDRFQHTNTIWPDHLREIATTEQNGFGPEKRTCIDFNSRGFRLGVDGSDQTLIFAESLDEECRGRIEVKFQRDPSSSEENPMYHVDYHLWSGIAGRASHRHVLLVNDIVVRPWSEWHKFRSGPHPEGALLKLGLAIEPSIPRMLRWEQSALAQIEKIDRALGKYRLALTPDVITVSVVPPPCEDCECCKIITDRTGGGVAIVLPKWLFTGQIRIAPLNARSPTIKLKGGEGKWVIPLTPKKLLRAGFKPRSILSVQLSPTDYVMFT